MMPDETGPPSRENADAMRQVAAGIRAETSPVPGRSEPPRRGFTLRELMPRDEEPPGPSLGPPRSVAAGEAPWLGQADPLDAEVASLLAVGDDSTASPTPRATPGVSELERSILGEMADPGARRAFEDLASRTRRAVAAGATEASRWAEGRIPEVDDEVIFRNAPFHILRVRDGGPKPRLDLISFRRGEPEVVAAVQADLAAGWSWLGEPDPPDPTSEDRVRAALAAGRPVPAVGSTVRLIRAKPPSYRGVERVALPAKVIGQVDVVGSVITLDLEVDGPSIDGLDPAASTGVIRGVPGPLQPHERREGWSSTVRESVFEKPDDRNFHQMPCQRCGAKLNHREAVQFLSRTSEDYTHPTIFAQLCRPCSDEFGRLAFVRPEPAARRLDGLGDYDGDHLDDLA